MRMMHMQDAQSRHATRSQTSKGSPRLNRLLQSEKAHAAAELSVVGMVKAAQEMQT